MSDEQLDWLGATIDAAKESQHVFAFLHHPRWRSSYYRGTNWDAVHDILKRHGNVRAVFAGHIHQSTHSGVRDGIEYLSLGTTGGSKYPDFPEAGHLHHFNIVTVRDEGVSHAIVPVGRVVDPRSLTDERLSELTKLARDIEIDVSPEIEIQPDGSSRGVVEVRIDRALDERVRATIRIDGAPTGYRVRPPHVHLGGSEIEEPFARFEVIGGPGATSLPAVFVEFEVVDEVIVRVPERRFEIPTRLADLPDDVFRSGSAHLEFDGDGDAVDLGASPPPDGPLTVEAWIRADAFSRRAPIIAKSQNSEFYLFASNGEPSFGVHLGGAYITASTSTRIPVGEWTHLAGQYDGATVRLFLNGQVVSTRKVSDEKRAAGRRTNALPLFVGADPNRRGDPVDFFDGAVDEVRISTIARYPGDTFSPRRRLEPDEETWSLLHFDRSVGPYHPDHSPRRASAREVGDPTLTEAARDR